MSIDELLGVDTGDPKQRLAIELVREDHEMLKELVALREQLKASQQEIGELMGISQSAVARIERGERDPRLSTLRRYAHAVGALIEHRVIPIAELKLRWEPKDLSGPVGRGYQLPDRQDLTEAWTGSAKRGRR
ncbi:MAG: helix-turn-helix domain-containing protein [Gulosibacter sp.]|uniref:helix-turn-helix domain-containing protein n=1 Tax=Gulosibacter sp. TaxID=2817531 RepID=UPI003F91E17D